MLETIKNGFVAILDFLGSAFALLRQLLADIGRLFSYIPHALQTARSAADLLPGVFLASALFCITVAIINRIINHKAGE